MMMRASEPPMKSRLSITWLRRTGVGCIIVLHLIQMMLRVQQGLAQFKYLRYLCQYARRSFLSVPQITSELIRAARALLRWEQRDLAEASAVSLPTVKRLEAKPGVLVAHNSTLAALRAAFEAAGVEFTNGDRPEVRLRQVHRKD